MEPTNANATKTETTHKTDKGVRPALLRKALKTTRREVEEERHLRDRAEAERDAEKAGREKAEADLAEKERDLDFLTPEARKGLEETNARIGEAETQIETAKKDVLRLVDELKCEEAALLLDSFRAACETVGVEKFKREGLYLKPAKSRRDAAVEAAQHPDEHRVFYDPNRRLTPPPTQGRSHPF